MAPPPLPPVVAANEPRSTADGPTGQPPEHFPFRNMRGGCWLLNYVPRNSNGRYDGTLRVENHQAGEAVAGRTASGDLYLRATIAIPLPGGGEEVLGTMPPPNPASGIPILPRKQYTHYLRVTKIDEGLSRGDEFALRLEFYRFTPQTSPFDPRFTLEDTCTATMVWETAPDGYPSSADFAEGDVMSHGTGQIAGRLRMGWVSNYYRKISLEIDTVNGAVVPQENSGSPTLENWKTIFDRVGYEFNQVTSQRNVPDEAEDPWNPAELHAAMTANRETKANLDREWRYHLLVVRNFTTSGLFGVMFDSNNAGSAGSDPNSTPREGLAIGTDLRLDGGSNWGVNAGRRFGEATSPFFRTAAHELGHAFGLYHTEADHSFLSRTDTILSHSTAAAPFDTQITWNYSTADLKRLRHFPDHYIRPGAVEFGKQTDTHPPITPDDSQADVPGLTLAVAPLRVDAPLGAPVRVEVIITNNGDAAIPVPENFGLSSSFTSGTVTDSSGTTRAFRPLVSYDRVEKLISLSKGESHTASLTLLGGPHGPLFQSTGLNTITANVSWSAGSDGEGHQATVSLSGHAAVLVTPPVDASHTAVAYKILTTPAAHTALVLGGDHLVEGIEAIDAALKNETLGPHYAVVEARRLATKFRTRKADVKAAEGVLDGLDVVASAAEWEKLRRLGVKVGGEEGV